MTAIALLKGLKIVDLGAGMAPALVTKMLAELGASVTRVEPEGGDPFANVYPAYLAWHAGAARASSGSVDALLADADVCIMGGEDHPELERRRDASAFSDRYPRLVVLDLADGPPGTEYQGPSTELLAQVRSGLVWEQEPGRPIINTFEPGTYGAALQGLIGLLGALFEREASGLGQVVTTSLFEGALPWIGSYWAKLEKPTPVADFVIPRGVSPLIFRSRDGRFIHLAIGGAGSKYGFYQALEIDDPSVLPSDSGMPKPGGSRRDFFGEFDRLAEHVAKKDCAELLARIWERGLPAEEVQEPGDCWSDPQIVHNQIVVTEPDGTRHIGLPFRTAVLANGASKRASEGRRPLEGVRVIDCGAFVAGPLAGVALVDLGADVLKIEAKQGDPNRSIFKSFTVANRGKRVIGVDMKHADGLKIVQELCTGADVVMNNFRPGVAARLGIDPRTLSQSNPALIALEAPAFGNDGPAAKKAGFDMVMQAWTGHEKKAAGEGNEPRWNRTNLVDVAGGMIGSVAVLAALLHRERTGQSVALESPLCNAGIYTLSELIQHPDGTFAGVPKLNHSLTGYTPLESLYQASDGWVAIVARGDRATSGLREALNLERSLSVDSGDWREAEGRLIAERIAQLDLEQIKSALAPHGVWVEPCRDGREQQILSDSALIERGTVRVTQHATFGKISEIGSAYTLSRSPLGNDLPAPLPGAQTRKVLGSLGYDDDAVERLYAERAVT